MHQGSKPLFVKKLSLVRSCVQMVKTIFKIQKMLLIGLCVCCPFSPNTNNTVVDPNHEVKRN